MNKKIIFLIISISFVLLAASILVKGITNNSITGKTIYEPSDSNLQTIKLKVSIPCSGHAFLIENALNKAGAENVDFQMPNIFIVTYNPNNLNKEQIMNIDLFKQYPATEIK
jgi:hypothetical protein